MVNQPTFVVTFPASEIALLTVDQPEHRLNLLSAALLEELDLHLGALEQRRDLAGLVVCSGKPEVFCAGADVHELAASYDRPRGETIAVIQRGQQVLRRLARMPFVTVAAIDGVCVGGGAELALWCDRRVVSDHERTRFGFPEVKLGLHPGWGGTARTPRMIGLANALELISAGRLLSSAEAVALGLAHGPVSPTDLFPVAVALIRDEQAARRFERDRREWSEPVPLAEAELEFLHATAGAAIATRAHPEDGAARAVLDLMIAGAPLDLDGACRLEADGLAQLLGSPANRALVNVFCLTARGKKDRGCERDDVTPATVNRVGVVGAGIMGAGIAAANLKRGMSVVLTDAAPGALERGGRQTLAEAAYEKRSQQVDAQRLLDMAPRLCVSRAMAALHDCELVVEAIVENLQVKQQVLRQLEEIIPEQAVVGSNTSTLSVTKLSGALRRPDRFCGIHFFNPVRRMRLVEVVRGDRTNDETVATVVAYARRLGKHAIVVRDSPGFLVNRLLSPYLNESMELLMAGVDPWDIEDAATSFGMPLGPLELYDMVGLDTAFYAGRVMWEAFPTRVNPSPILPALMKAGRLGQKSGRGFFQYPPGVRPPGTRPQRDAAADQILERYVRRREAFSRDQLQHRLLLPMFLEATRVLAEQVVRDWRDVDLGLIFGLGFPAFRGGLLWWADQAGIPRLLEWLKPWESLGERFQPTPLLLDMARRGARFYGERRP